MAPPVTPLLAADIIIELNARARQIVLIGRKNPPLGWALPGGFVDVGETVEQAAVREAREETGLIVHLQCLLGCYSEPGRDPRGHTASLVYVAQADGLPEARDDAAMTQLVDPDQIDLELVFDHGRILADYCILRDTGCAPQWGKACRDVAAERTVAWGVER